MSTVIGTCNMHTHARARSSHATTRHSYSRLAWMEQQNILAKRNSGLFIFNGFELMRVCTLFTNDDDAF